MSFTGVCRKCPCFEDSLHTDSGMWCSWWKDDDKPDCSMRLALEALESERNRLFDLARNNSIAAEKALIECDTLKEQLQSANERRILNYDSLMGWKKRAESAEAERDQLKQELKTAMDVGADLVKSGMKGFQQQLDEKETEVKRLQRELFDEQTRRSYWETAEKQEKGWRIDVESRLLKAQELVKEDYSCYPTGCDKCKDPSDYPKKPYKNYCTGYRFGVALGSELE